MIQRLLLIVLVPLVLLTGCKDVDQLDLSLSDSKLTILLTNPKATKTIYLQDLAVIRLNCNIDCDYWGLLSKDSQGAALMVNTEGLISITYGRTPEGINVTTPALPLKEGKYQIGGTFTTSGKGGKTSQLMSRVFTLTKNSNGTLTLI